MGSYWEGKVRTKRDGIRELQPSKMPVERSKFVSRLEIRRAHAGSTMSKSKRANFSLLSMGAVYKVPKQLASFISYQSAAEHVLSTRKAYVETEWIFCTPLKQTYYFAFNTKLKLATGL
mmetsp:Transcript_44518/g.172689  ORF Transcript_44518/g.172689 Transcript_44518/m.172689 type:complete len:119 (-) Transcript_44518:87-443(-)